MSLGNTVSMHVDSKDEWIMVVGGELPKLGTILEHEGEQVQVIAEGVRVTRGFNGSPIKQHRGLWPVIWDILARPSTR